MPNVPSSRGKTFAGSGPTQTGRPAEGIRRRRTVLGAAILAARTAAGLSQIELAAKLKTAQANIARLEKAGSIPSTNLLQRVAKATGHKLTITFSRNV